MKALIIIITLLTSVLCFARGGDVSAGGGISESNILYSFYNLEEQVNPFIKIDSSYFTDNEIYFLESILKGLPYESKTKLIFKKESEYDFSGLSFIASRIVGSDIYINLDRLHTLRNQVKVPFTLTEALIFTLRFLNRQNTTLSLTELEILFSKIKKLHSVKTNKFDLTQYNRAELQVSTYTQNNNLKLLLMDSYALTDYSSQLNKSLLCPSKKSIKTVKTLSNIFMYRSEFFSNTEQITFKADIQYNCDDLIGYGNLFIVINYDLKSKTKIDKNWWESKEVKALINKDSIEFIPQGILFE